MAIECELVTSGLNWNDYSGRLRGEIANRALDWRLLLQLGSDEERLGVMWGDVGRLYFWRAGRARTSLRRSLAPAAVRMTASEARGPHGRAEANQQLHQMLGAGGSHQIASSGASTRVRSSARFA
jgi:Domain of unknown function (DUF1963)